MAELNQYINKAFDYEEKGYVEEAIQLCSKCIQAFPEYKNEIEFEIAKMNYRNGKEEQALIQFLTLYQKTGDSEIHDLILEAYYGVRQQEFEERYQGNYKQLENYPHFFGNRAPSEIRYYPLLAGEDWIWYYDNEEKAFKDINRCRIAMKEPHDAVCIGNDLLWMEDILMLEKLTRKVNPFMDMENALLLVYQKETWELLLQLLDLKDLLDFDRIVFYDDKNQLEASFLEGGVCLPSIATGNRLNEISRILIESNERIQQECVKYRKEAVDYYKANSETVIRHIKEGKPKILFITSRFTTALQYHTRDCRAAAEKMGLETELVIEKDRLATGTDDMFEIRKIAKFKPDIIFCIDYFRSKRKYIPDEVIWITWIQDKLPQSTGNKEIIESLSDRDIIISAFISDLNGTQWGMNYKDVLKAPISVSSFLYKEWALSQEEKKKYGCDICIVANASDYLKTIEELAESLPEEARYDFRDIIKVYIDLMEQEQFFYGFENNFEIIKYIASQLGIMWREDSIRSVSDSIYYSIFYRRYKSLVAEWLIDNGYTNIKLYGNEWNKNEKFRPFAMGVIENGEKLSKALRASKIAIGLHPHVSLPARLIESIASGTLYIAHDIPKEFDLANAREYFKEDKELIYYYNKQDLLDKIHYYLVHEEERKKIIKAGQNRIAKDLSYEKMLERIMKETIEVIERREGKEGKANGRLE